MPDDKKGVSRRDLLKRAGLAGAAITIPLTPATSADALEQARPAAAPTAPAAPRREAVENLTAAEAETLEAICARLIPSDANGPGAREARAAHFIDRALGGALKESREAYRAGFAAFDRYCRSSRGAPFVELSVRDQDSVLMDVESGSATGFTGSSGAFFAMVRTHTLQGTFGDPYYGGNANFVGWDLIGFPGLRLNVSVEDQRLGAKLTPTHRSAYDTEMFNKAQARAEDTRRTEFTEGVMATRLKDTDVVVVGLGAAGGVAVLPLTQAGIDVVGLEAGTWLTKKDFAPDELRNNVRDWPMAVQKAQQEVPTHRVNAKANTTRAGSHPMMNAVGGTTLHYWAQSWRLNPWDFKVVSDTTKRYGASRLPKGSTVEDWPFGLDELEPYYDKIEYECGVSGQAGNIKGTIDPRGNIFEGARNRAYPMPPLRSTGFIDLMTSAARGLGWSPFPGPASINSRTYQGRSACMYHGFCNKGGCHVDAKNGPHLTTIPRAQETGRLKVVTRAHVTSIDTDASGRVTGVTYVTDGQEFFQPAKVVLLASYTYENSRLLLLSKSKAYPNGLSNNHGQVGRHYMTHAQGGSVTALFPFNINAWYGLPAQGVAVDNFADDNFDHGGQDYIGGGNLWVMSDRRPISAASMGTFGRTQAWGSEWKAFVMRNADRTNSSYLQKTTLPYEDNFLDLDPVVKDPLGFPVCRITADYKDNERRVSAMAQEKMTEWYKAAGAIVTQSNPIGTMGPTTHAYGGTRMGRNPETNVVNEWGFSHEAPNLGVLGASVMGTSGARNPTLTAQALAWRTAEYLAKNWRAVTV